MDSIKYLRCRSSALVNTILIEHFSPSFYSVTLCAKSSALSLNRHKATHLSQVTKCMDSTGFVDIGKVPREDDEWDSEEVDPTMSIALLKSQETS